MPVQRSAPEFEGCIVPHLAMPQRGLTCTLGSYRVFHLIVWGLSTGRQRQCLAVPTEARGNPAIHDTTVDTVFTKRAADGSLWQACIARVAHRAAAKHIDTSVLHGDGTNTVATTGAMELDRLGTSPRQGSRVSRSQTIMALSSHPPLLLPPMRQT
jgi:hypothetical protein